MDQNKPKPVVLLHLILNSYSQVFFSTSKLLAVFLILISFFDYGAGIGGLVSVLIATALAYGLGYNKYLLHTGMYGFNALLAGLGIGLIYTPSPEVFLLIAVAAITCFFFTAVLQGVLGKYGLPFLSLPFLFTIWIVVLSGSQLTALDLSQRGIFTYNELYALGGPAFTSLYEWLERSITSVFIRIYFHSLGAIFFQPYLAAGIIIAIGLLIYSRITFLLSLFGYLIAYLFYSVTGIEFTALGYTFIGFNYILTAIALGGYYLVPGRVSLGWIIILLPAVVLITTSSQQFFLQFRISPYSLPFNVVVLMFLYALKLREQRPVHLVETPVQLGVPEKNLYLYSSNTRRFPAAYPVAASLPFYGEWKISQGHNGDITHKNEWRHAWDFIINGSDGKQFKNTGDFPEDYYCFDKVILAPADGEIMEVTGHIPDNTIGQVNLKENWGNVVIIKHSPYIYSKAAHLKQHSIEVKPGQKVKRGQVIGRCGNSGRSPYPHLHFQFQALPYTGSPTLDYPFAHFLLKTDSGFDLKSFSFPEEDQQVTNPARNEQLAQSLLFSPGLQMEVEAQMLSSVKNRKKIQGRYHWETDVDIYNTTFIRDDNDNRIYLYNDGFMHYFTNYTGKRNSPLFWFFAALYKVPLGYIPGSRLSDILPIHFFFGGILKWMQDLVAPLGLFLKAEYKLNLKSRNNVLDSDGITLQAEVKRSAAGFQLDDYRLSTFVKDGKNIEIEVLHKHAQLKIICREKQDI